MRIVTLTATTDGSGDATVNSASVFVGALYAVRLVDGNFDDGVDITVTSVTDDLNVSQLTKADFNTDQVVYPRVLQALNTDGTALTTHCEPLIAGRLRVVVAQGGAAKTGSFVFYIREL
jgi:hypothetical protein